MSGAPTEEDHHAAPSGGGGSEGEGLNLSGPAKGFAGVAKATGITLVGAAVCSLCSAIFGGR